MANLKEIRTRMASVKTTRQVTSAMKMVSAAKLRKAQEAIIRIRPYAGKLHDILSNLSESLSSMEDNPYAIDRGYNRVLLVVINSNRGLCGGFNANVNKKALQLAHHEFGEQLKGGDLDVLAIGKSAFDFFTRRDFSVKNENDLYDNLDFDHVSPIAKSVMKAFTDGMYDKVYLVYNQFKNAATQILTSEQFLPIVQEENEESNSNIDYLFEPSKEEIVKELIPKSLKIQFYRAILDSNAAEHGARMTAMHKATDNATDLLKELKLHYNKARQTSITGEILEIVSGAEALNG